MKGFEKLFTDLTILKDWARALYTERLCPLCHVPFVPSQPQTPFLPQNFMCAACFSSVQIQHARPCSLCGHALPLQSVGTVCLQCLHKPPPWDALVFYAPYASVVKQSILQYKYSRKVALIPLLSAFLYAAALSLPPSDICIPMARHVKRLKMLGHNQMLDVCRKLGPWLNIPVNIRALYRTRYTLPQASLQKSERHKNPRASFAACEVQGQRVLLVDDVMTTGATVHHAALALRQAGAEHISVLLVARAEK